MSGDNETRLSYLMFNIWNGVQKSSKEGGWMGDIGLPRYGYPMSRR